MNSANHPGSLLRILRTPGPSPLLCPFFVILLVSAAHGPLPASETPPPLRLAISLSMAGDHEEAALEFRRQALDAAAPASKAAFFWSAAHEYHRASQPAQADRMLDNVEDADPGLLAPTLLLRGESAAALQDWPSSSFYFHNLAATGGDSDMTRFAGRRLAVTELERRNTTAAREALRKSPADESIPLAALDQYERGRDKHPWLGGLLGMIPGLGYAYSGEYANAGRSLILNSLFLFGMLRTADDENWGAFAAISFFELTWYSGSIYGGIDAAHRYNQDRLETCSQGIMNHASFDADYTTLPALSIQFRF